MRFARGDDLGRAMHDYDEAIRLNPHYAHAFNNRGIVFLELGNMERAIADFDSAIHEESSYANAFRNRGIARTQQRLFDLAIEDLEKAFELSPALGHGAEYALALFGRGVARQRAGNPAGLHDIQAATRLLPDVAGLIADLAHR